MRCSRCGTATDQDMAGSCARCLAEFALGEDGPPESPGPQAIGRYRVLGVLGSGGMGVVYRAEDPTLGREVAVKVLRLAAHRPGDIERFTREARAMARLSHPQIVPVYEFGWDSGWAFYAAERIPGGSLAARLRQGPLDPPMAAQLVAQVARALHHAHEQGVIHRDLKPSNILLTSEGEPRVTDFGIARDLLGAAATESGVAMGTPAYMAPEQVRGERGRTDRRTDVYGLGATLYECLTGGPPFPAGTPEEIFRQVLGDDPVFPRRIPRDLVAICRQAMEKEPGRRYASARDLADDLERFLRGEAIRARGGFAARRWVRRVWRHRWPLVAASGVLAVVSLLATGESPKGVSSQAVDALRRGRESYEESLRLTARDARPARWAKLEEARGFLAEALGHDRRWQEPAELLARVLLRMGRTREAEQVARETGVELAEARFSRPERWFGFILFHELPDLEDAGALEQALDADLYDASLYRRHALALLALPDPPEEILLRDVNRAVDFDPASWESWTLRAGVFLRQGHWEDVLDHADEIDSLLPASPLGPLLRAVVYRQPSSHDAVRSDAEIAEALRRDPRDAAALFARAEALALGEDRWVAAEWSLAADFGRRRALLNEAVEAAPGWAVPRAFRARLRLIAGDVSGCREDLDRGAVPAALQTYADELRQAAVGSPPDWLLFARAQDALERDDGGLALRSLADLRKPHPFFESYLPYYRAWALALEGRSAEACDELSAFLSGRRRWETVAAAEWTRRLAGTPEFERLSAAFGPRER